MVCYFNFTFSIIKPLYSNYNLQDKKKKRKRKGKSVSKKDTIFHPSLFLPSPFTTPSGTTIAGEGLLFTIRFTSHQTETTRYTFPNLVCLRSIPTAISICAKLAGFAPRIAAGFIFFNR